MTWQAESLPHMRRMEKTVNLIKRFFRLDELGSNVATEARAGLATFMTMAYIIFVQPVILSKAGMDAGSVMVATCVASAIATLTMGLLANYPVALAPGMGTNAFFAFIVCGTMGVDWQVALGAVFISGLLLLVLSLIGIREQILNSIPPSLKNAIAVGIGLLIAMVGFQYAGIIVDHPTVLVRIGDLTHPAVLVSLAGLAVTLVLVALNIRGAVLIGIIGTTAMGLVAGVIPMPATDGSWISSIVRSPPSMAPTFLQLDVVAALREGLFFIIFVFFMLDLFDTIGTLVGVSQQAGLMKDGKLPRAKAALTSDAIGTMLGAALGTSTVTSYVESSAGVSEGGRSGLANVVTAALFLLALFFAPLVALVGREVVVETGGGRLFLHPAIAPVLIIMGSTMMRNIRWIDWDDATEWLPAFLCLIVMPFTLSITEGIAFGFISYVLLKLATGRFRDVHPLMYVFSAAFVFRYVIMAEYLAGGK